MEDYTKFRLKRPEELAALLSDKDNLYIIACNKCFKEFTPDEEPECGEFAALARDAGKTVAGCEKIDFLCNKHLSSKVLETIPQFDPENVIVISCGLGVQTVADLTALPTYAASDSISHGSRHGMALTKRLCDACGQCFLNVTAGVCPIADCAKGLVNGQCGGAKNGKCEVDKEKNCAWEEIFGNLNDQDRVSEYYNQPVQIRDYSRINFKLIDNYIKSIRKERFEGYFGGLHPHELKEFTESSPIEVFPPPQRVVLPLSQHTGAPAEPIVKAGDAVKVGQKVGEATSYVSCPVHSSVSGTVVAVEPRRQPNTGLDVLSVIIDSDGKNELHESVAPCNNYENLSPDDLIALIRDKGIVGMGGAGFPTSVKLKSPKPIDTVLLNGCECEPLLTADHRVMLEYADEVIFCLKVLIKATGAEKGIIVIEDNKPDVIGLMEAKTNDMTNIEIKAVRTKYPQGAEKMLIKSVLNRHVPSGALPLDVGVIVSNVSTSKAISDAIQKGVPLIERVVTVTGKKIKNPGNLIVKIGTSVKELIDYRGGVTDNEVMIKIGGPMMGFEISDLNVPVIKTTNGIIAVEPLPSKAAPCIRCGRCLDVCPMELYPLNYPNLADKQDWKLMRDKAVNDCIECGCCDYICSSKIPIRDSIKAGKKAIKDIGI